MQVSVNKLQEKSRERTFTLTLEELSQNDANFLFTLFGQMSGVYGTSGRTVGDEIYHRLREQGAVYDARLVSYSPFSANKYPETPATE